MAAFDPTFHAALTGLTLFLQRRLDEARRDISGGALSAAEWQALEYVGSHPGQRQSELAAALGVVPTTASSLVGRLAKRGILTSAPMAADGRSVALSLTSEGQDMFDRLAAGRQHAHATVFAAVPDPRRDLFASTLIETVDRLSRRET